MYLPWAAEGCLARRMLVRKFEAARYAAKAFGNRENVPGRREIDHSWRETIFGTFGGISAFGETYAYQYAGEGGNAVDQFPPLFGAGCVQIGNTSIAAWTNY